VYLAGWVSQIDMSIHGLGCYLSAKSLASRVGLEAFQGTIWTCLRFGPVCVSGQKEGYALKWRDRGPKYCARERH
jgi:hypothetical protein